MGVTRSMCIAWVRLIDLVYSHAELHETRRAIFLHFRFYSLILIFVFLHVQ